MASSEQAIINSGSVSEPSLRHSPVAEIGSGVGSSGGGDGVGIGGVGGGTVGSSVGVGSVGGDATATGVGVGICIAVLTLAGDGALGAGLDATGTGGVVGAGWAVGDGCVCEGSLESPPHE